MTIRFPGSEGEAAAREFSEVDLGDVRLSARLQAVAYAMAEHPALSFSRMCGEEAEREGLYRLLRNPRVLPESILVPHIVSTIARSAAKKQVLVVHDTTTVKVDPEADIESYLHGGTRGFKAHVSLVVEEGTADPLGVCGLEVVLQKNKQSKLKKNNKPMSAKQMVNLEDKQSERWIRGVSGAAEKLEGIARIHVMDRESDSFTILSQMSAADESFVVRLCHNRRTAGSNKEGATTYLDSVLAGAKTFRRTISVAVSKRKATTFPSKGTNRSREARNAKLTLSYARTRLLRPAYLGDEYLKEIPVTVVRAIEKSPVDGETPIEWKILTSLEVNSKADVERVLGIYSQRWIIEEYFRALKSGCGMHKRRLINEQSILNSLVTFVPIAWRALWLRQRAREDSEEPATTSFASAEIAVLQIKMPNAARKLTKNPTVNDIWKMLAEFGGHRKRSGPPGWSSIMTGLQKLLPLAAGWQLRGDLEM